MILINSSPKNSLRVFQPFLPIFVPVGIGYLAAVLKEQGVASIVFDEQVENCIPDKIEQIIHEFEPPYVFGFSVLTAAYHSALSMAELLKQRYPESVVIFGGIHPTAMPDEVLQNKQVDIVVRGEAEYILPDLYKRVKKRQAFDDLESVSFRQGNKILHNKRSAGVKDLDALPAFPYELFNNRKYDQGFIMSSRGCPHDCIFCSNKINSQKRFRFRNPDDVIADLILLYEKYNRKYIYFIDDNLLVNKPRTIELARKIQESKIAGKMIYNFQARGDNCDREVMEILYDAGFRGVYFGIETASEELMASLNKGETVKQVVQAIKISKEIGFHVSVNYIFGLPGETHKDRMDAIRLTKQLSLDLVKYNNATPYPGTELYNIAKSQNRLFVSRDFENLNSVSTFIENPFNKIPLAYVPPHNTEKELRQDILHGYFSFYLNIKRLKEIFTRPDLNNAWFDFGHNFKDFIVKLPATIFLGFIFLIKITLFLIEKFVCFISKYRSQK